MSVQVGCGNASVLTVKERPVTKIIDTHCHIYPDQFYRRITDLVRVSAHKDYLRREFYAYTALFGGGR